MLFLPPHTLTLNNFFSVLVILSFPRKSHKYRHIAKLSYFTHRLRKRWHTEQGSSMKVTSEYDSVV